MKPFSLIPRREVVAFLMMLSIVMSSGTFAYWANFVEGTSMDAVGSLSVGSGDEISTQFELTNQSITNAYLVPSSQ